MPQINSQAKTIKDLLTRTYQLDYYQREYSWQTKHVVELLEDFYNEFWENYAAGDTPLDVQNYGHYFLGSIIISIDRKEGKRYIVDGQQRLVTLTLLLIRIHKLLADESLKMQVSQLIYSLNYGKKGFNLDVEEWHDVTSALYEGGSFDITGHSESTQNIVLRYRDIVDNFRVQDQQELESFVYWLLENVYFVEIATEDSKHAYMIFETVNDRGLSLTPTDMLKGYLLSGIENDKKLRKELNEIWDRRIRVINKRKGKGEESDAIKAWLRSQYAGDLNHFDRIGSEFHRWVREKEDKLGLTANSGVANFIENSFESYGRWYCYLRDAAETLSPGLECIYYNAQHKFTLQYPILLAPLRMDDSEEVILQKIQVVSKYLDIVLHRRIWNFQAIEQRTMIAPMFPLMCKIRGKGVDELSDILFNSLVSLAKVDGTFANERRFRLQNNLRKLHLILARMTDYVGVQSGQSSRYLEYVEKGAKGYEVEHIWANHFERHRHEFPHEYDFQDYRNRIGGLLLLPKKNNASYNDLPYADKRKHYLKENLLAQSLHENAYERTPGFNQFIDASCLPFESHAEFKKADMDKRQHLYLQLAERIWDPERLRLPYNQEPDPITIQDEEEYYQVEDQGVWTVELVKDSVPPEYREIYETEHQNKVSEIYRQVAALRNLVQETEWGRDLEFGFRKYYCAFYYGSKRVFGIDLFGAPRFCIWITQEEAEDFRDTCEFASYDSSHAIAIYPSNTTVDVLLPILEFAFKKHTGP